MAAQNTYDTRGLLVTATMAQAVTSAPENLASGVSWANHTTYGYDHQGRTSSETLHTASPASTWTTTYSHDRVGVTTDAPGPGLSRNTYDAFGRLASVAEHNGSVWDTTSYTYQATGELASITDAAGNAITYIYDRLGRRTGMADPDAGSWQYSYDLVGNQTRVVDADPATPDLHLIYDNLNRLVERRSGSVSGPVLAEWDYDAAGEKGLLDRSVRHDPGLGELVVDVDGYDPRGRPTGRTWVFPSSLGNLAGTYAVGYTYDRADYVVSTSLPAVAGLGAEVVTATFHPVTGTPLTLSGADDYVSATTLDSRNRVATRTLGAGTDPDRVVRTYGYDPQQRLTTWHAAAASATVLQDDRLVVDEVGNVTERFDARVGQRECFGYDPRNRLTSAYTTTTACGTPNSAGPDPYDHTYTYAPDGKLTSRDQGAGPVAYAYPTQGPGSVRPHAVTTVGTDSYGYDPNGQMTSRPGAGAQQTLEWNAEHQLVEVDDDGDLTRFVYGPDGDRLARIGPDDTTIYWDGHEIIDDATTVRARRTYTLGAVAVGVRDPGGLSWLLGDHLGSTTLVVDTDTATPTRHRYLPYGAPRGSTATNPVTDRSWIGQIHDDTTGLHYLNARYYDPNTARFLSTDPISDLSHVDGADAYGYSRSSPLSLSDPTGLLPSECLTQANWVYCELRDNRWEIINRHTTVREAMAEDARNAERRSRSVVGRAVNGFVSGASAPLFPIWTGFDAANCVANDRCDWESTRFIVGGAVDAARNPLAVVRGCAADPAFCAGALLGAGIYLKARSPGATPTGIGTAERFSVHSRVAAQLDDARLGSLAGRYGVDDLEGLLHAPGSRAYFDTATRNINVVQEVDGVLLRITTASDEFRIISVGRLRDAQLENGIANGRFVPIGPAG